jgi:hypothetical protein
MTMELLVNRVEVWGGYRPIHLREPDKPNGKIWTKPARPDRGRRLLTEAIIAKHYAGRDVGHLIGLHSTSEKNTSKWGAVDVDWHGDKSPPPKLNLSAALGWYQKLSHLGFVPLLTDSNGCGGYHLVAIFDQPVATPLVFAFLRWLVGDYAEYGLSAPPETFPKQPRIDARNCYGNWLRLPGRHHTREHWSRVWSGREWLSGQAAVQSILSAHGSPAELIPAHVVAEPPRVAESPRRPSRAPAIVTGPELSRRIIAYMSKLPHLCEGQGRDNVAYHFAAFLVRDLALSDDAALDWLVQWDGGNRPPKGAERLREIIASAHHYGKHAYASGSNAPRRGVHPHGAIRFSFRI